jgi:translation elongation factor P/translation initiation factor 5A
VADTSDIRNGLIMNVDGEYWSIQEFLHVKPGKGGAFVRTKIKNLLTGQVKDQTFRSGEKVNEVRVVRQPFQFLYASGGLYHMMDRNTYEQIELPESLIDEYKDYLKENMNLDILMDGVRWALGERLGTRKGVAASVAVPIQDLLVDALGWLLPSGARLTTDLELRDRPP